MTRNSPAPARLMCESSGDPGGGLPALKDPLPPSPKKSEIPPLSRVSYVNFQRFLSIWKKAHLLRAAPFMDQRSTFRLRARDDTAPLNHRNYGAGLA